MGGEILKWFEANLSLISTNGYTLELGSLDVNGSVREYFGEDYVGIDIEAGKSVDRVMNANDIGGLDERFDCVLSLNLFEHDRYFWKTVEGVKKVLKPGGTFVVVTPTFFFPIHRYPRDYYRFGEDAFREVFFDGYDIVKLDTVNTKPNVNPVICAIGKLRDE